MYCSVSTLKSSKSFPMSKDTVLGVAGRGFLLRGSASERIIDDSQLTMDVGLYEIEGVVGRGRLLDLI